MLMYCMHNSEIGELHTLHKQMGSKDFSSSITAEDFVPEVQVQG